MHRTSLTKCHFYKVGKHNKSRKYIEIKIANWAKRDDRETCFKQQKIRPQKKKLVKGDRQPTQKSYRVMVVKMIKELGRKFNEQKEMLEVVIKEKIKGQSKKYENSNTLKFDMEPQKILNYQSNLKKKITKMEA